MSKNTRPVGGPTAKYGPATGIPTPEPKNETLGDGRYSGASTPGTSNEAYPGHVADGPGHDTCDAE